MKTTTTTMDEILKLAAETVNAQREVARRAAALHARLIAAL
jgi:hypothetical protein